jgi:hypothetical protein
MRVKRYSSWQGLVGGFLAEYHKLPAMRQQQLIFRGHADSRWPLRATLDRYRTFGGSAERATCLDRLIGQFRQQALSLRANIRAKTHLEWELLGRHHGLPTTVLDFTYLPYVAAYFAFADPASRDAKYSSVWALDRQVFDPRELPQLELLDEEEYKRFNPRAQEQRRLFLKIKDVSQTVEELLGDALIRYDIPVSQRQMALTALDRMTVNARNLFRDLDAAARTAACNVLVLEEG